MKLRQGKAAGRTIYLQEDQFASDDDQLVGLVDTEALAKRICEAQDDINELREEAKSQMHALADKQSDVERWQAEAARLRGVLDQFDQQLRSMHDRMGRTACQDVMAQFRPEIIELADICVREVLVSKAL